MARFLFRLCWINATCDQTFTEEAMTLPDGFCNIAAFLRKTNSVVIIHRKITAGTKLFHGMTNAGFAYIQPARHINRTHSAQLTLENKDGFKIIFRTDAK